MSTLISSIGSIVDSVSASPVGAFTQELLLLGVFLISYAIWHRLGQRSKQLRAARKLNTCVATDSPEKKKVWRSPTAQNRASTTEESADWERSSPQVAPEAALKAVEAQMLKHLEQREFTRALNMYRSLERDGRERNFSEELYSAFIQSAVRVGKVDVVERLLREMKRSGLVPSLKFWQITLKMLSSRKHFSTCLSIHSLFGRKLPTDKVIFSCFINAALEVGSPDVARTMLEKYSEAGLDAKDHVLFFRTYVALKDVDSAEAVFHKLDAEITPLMLNLLLLTCVSAGQTERALKLLHEANHIEKREGAEKTIVDVVSFNTVIKGFSHGGAPSKAFDCLHEMSAKGIDPDDITFGTLLDACITDNNVGAASEIVNIVMKSNRPVDTIMCTSFIKGLVRANCLHKALELCEEMKQRKGASPDIVTYSVLIKALVDQHDLDRALSLVEDMKVAGHLPDDIILTHLLEGCRYAGNHALGKQLFIDMLAHGVKPSEFTLVTLLKLHGRCGAHKEAHDLVAGWEVKYGYKPSVIHFTCLMSGCLRTKNYDFAWAAYELMCAHKVPADGTTMSTLLPGMVAAQQWERVLSLAREALALPRKYTIPSETLNNALSQMQPGRGNSKGASELKDLMQAAGVHITSRHVRRAGY